METVDCDLCGSSNYLPVVSQTDILHKTTTELFTVVKCLDCGLHYTNPRPNRSEIGEFYSKSYSFHSNRGWKSRIKTSFIWDIFKKFANSSFALIFFFLPPISKFLASQLKSPIKDPVTELVKKGEVKSFLDIGCGSGLSAHYWGTSSSLVSCNKHVNVFGLEQDEEACSSLNLQGIKCWQSLDKVELGISFDLIRMNWSLEHVHSPTEYFKFISERLNENGTIVIGIPNNEGLLYRLAPSCLELPIHLYHFSIQDIKEYASQFNLKVLDVKTFSYPSMFSVPVAEGLLPKDFLFSKSIFRAKRAMRFLKSFDEIGWGNDMLITLKKKI